MTFPPISAFRDARAEVATPDRAEGDGSKSSRSWRTVDLCDHPFLFHLAWTKTRASGPDDKSRTAEEMDNLLPQTVGIDISKATPDVYAHPVGCERQFPN